MGKYDDVMYRYLTDNNRFADLFNAVLFGGEKVLRGELLESCSERYVDTVYDSSGEYVVTSSGFRDIKKRLRTGEGFVVVAVENQNDIDYTMPWRIMDYDRMEYGRQLEALRKARRADRKEKGLAPSSWAERPGRQDLLHPVYTICFYHGTEPWDGPRSLKDMMDFSGEAQIWKQCFQDYGMHLFCAGNCDELKDFKTELRRLLEVLPLRKDKQRLSELWSREEFAHLDRDTMEAMAVLTDSTEILNKMERYREEGGYNMCLAVEEMRRDWKAEGKAEGNAEGKASQMISIIDSMMEKMQCSLEAACELAGKTLGEYYKAQSLLNR